MYSNKEVANLKKFYKENRVFVILMGIALVCISIIIAMMASYVVNSSTRDKYGNRLDGISDVAISDKKVTEMENAVLEMERVQDVVVNIHGKIVNFNIDFQEDVKVDEVQNAAIKCVDFFDEDYLNYYDLQFLITSNGLDQNKNDESTSSSDDDEKDEVDPFPMIGYRKAGAANITWSNNSKK